MHVFVNRWQCGMMWNWIVGQKEPGQKEPHTLGQKVPGIGQKEPQEK